jgi:serine/threonine-protein kinase
MTGSDGIQQAERKAMTLLEEALEQPSEDRKAWLENCGEPDPNVRALALAMLAADKSTGGSLRTGGADAVLPEGELVPPQLPGYRVLRQLGRGGMGAVWLAERDGSDFEHRVAIKVIKPGVLEDSLVARFRRERQILAGLNHPHIAHLHDGGETADQQPYIVMEYIRGITLREWLEQRQPDLPARLALFRQIADAVGFAHQNLVIHRDLTPNNVLVTDAGQAKLIDFGIARPPATEADKPAPSPLSRLTLTPGFAAPERATGLASNTLTDIYSLGRLLALMAEGQGKPELDAIAARASAADPAQRYASVSDMVDDVEHFADGRVVPAYSIAPGYRFGKFVRREKTLVVASSLAILSLVAGLIIAIWAYDRAETARAEAEQRFGELRALARFQLFDLYDRLDSVPGNTQARVALAQNAQDYLVSLAASRTDDPELQLETARGFLRLALIQGVPAFPNFGEPKLAGENLDRAEPIFRSLATQGIAAGETGLARTEAYRALWLAHSEGKPDEALKAVGRAEQALERVPVDQRDWEWMQARRVTRLAALERGDLQMESDAIEAAGRKLEADINDWPREKRGGYEERFDRAMAENYRAVVDQNRSGTGEKPDTALLRQSLDRYLAADKLFGALEADFRNDPMVLLRRAWNAYYGYAAAATLEDDPVTERLLVQARESVARLMTVEEADNTLNTFDERLREAQAQFLSNQNRHSEAIALMQQVIDGRRAKVKPNGRSNPVSDLAYGQAIFGTIYRKAGKRAEACAVWAEAEALMADLEQRKALHGFVDQLRGGVKANLARCKAGEPVTSFKPLDSGGN